MFNFIYDPQRQGYDTGLWKTLSGTPTASGNDLLFNADSAIQYADCLRGAFTFKITFPATPAAGYLTGGGAATSNYATWAAVTDGEFALTIDGEANDITAIDFTGVTDMDEVAAVIQVALRNQSGTLATVIWSTDHFVITGKTQVSVLSAVSGGTGTDISGAGATTFLDGETAVGTATSGDNKIFGLYSLNKNIKAIFEVYGDELRCITNDEDDETVTSIVPWVSSWSSAASTWSIKWGAQGVSFYVNEVQVASHLSDVPNGPMSVYINNTDSDNLLFSYIEGTGIESYL